MKLFQYQYKVGLFIVILMSIYKGSYANTQSLNTSIECIDILLTRPLLIKSLEDKKAKIKKIIHTSRSTSIECTIPKDLFSSDSFLTEVESWGFVKSYHFHSNDNDHEKTILSKIAELKENLEWKEKTLKNDSLLNILRFETKKHIRLHKLELVKYLKRKNNVHVKIDISEEFSRGKIRFINMPGVEYSILFLDNTVAGRTNIYNGIALKYQFTRGKSYVLFGIRRHGSPSRLVDGEVKDVFDIGFGQDFYSRWMGRGKNTFFNPYVGYSLGGSVLTLMNKEGIKGAFIMMPHIGIELLKLKYCMIDVKGGYYMPISSYSSQLRGFHTSLSFNVVW